MTDPSGEIPVEPEKTVPLTAYGAKSDPVVK